MSKNSQETIKILVIQTAFIGDVILATPLLEFLHSKYPSARIDFVLRKGNEGLLKGHPFIDEVFIWDKSKKYKSLFRIIKMCNRRGPYDMLFNLQRFFTTGIMAALIRAKEKVGFRKNPLSFLYTRSVIHQIEDGTHEVQRNLRLVEHIDKNAQAKVKLYPTSEDRKNTEYNSLGDYITISPASVWYTKQLPAEKWVELINELPQNVKIFLLGGPGDRGLCDQIKSASKKSDIQVLAGKTSFLETAALMQKAIINYSNDSAPLHLASSQNANVCAVYCSTVPEFGFGPLSDFSQMAQVDGLDCKPCGLHGHKECPQGHFDCGWKLDVKKLLNAYNDALNFRVKANNND